MQCAKTLTTFGSKAKYREPFCNAMLLAQRILYRRSSIRGMPSSLFERILADVIRIHGVGHRDLYQ